MAKKGTKNAIKSKKDKVQTKFGPAGIVKAKDKRKKPAALKKMKEQLGEEIQNANNEFVELQTKMISEKESKENEDATSKEIVTTKITPVLGSTTISDTGRTS
ncbi:uncharacterized protein LOC114516719 [Dendronephthya gigantea]|uniref:uncharacterized protein LOC114516719 n=1 Tax=Dendronephthya gigantea TaxID=151771 RepID=UPI001069E8F1|nr:uncharacterized protein LOC114516719 [Dendronephthya gigantea]